MRGFWQVAEIAALSIFLLAFPAQAESDSKPGSGAACENGSLSEKLDRSNGVIKPRDDIDPGIAKPTPPAGSATPVIPPPGSPGGDPNVQPK
jgi:hypothetical protein